MSKQFALQICRGANLGKTWAIGPLPLVIGRSSECDIRIVDATISRRHCEVWLTDSGPRIKDLESSNATVVNGDAVSESDLTVGDEITIGPYSLKLVEIDTPQARPRSPIEDSTPATLSLSEAFFIQDPLAPTKGFSPPSHVSEFRELLRINREFARSLDVNELMNTLDTVLKQKFEPDAWWLVRVVGADKKLVPHPLSSGATHDALPAQDIQRALKSESGILVPRRRAESGKSCIETTIVAPLVLADERIGALAVRSGMPRRIYDEADLEFFVALAHTFTPYLRAAEQTEQLRRDMARLQDEIGPTTALIGNSTAVKEVRDLAARAAKSDLPVLVLGETGTGKELLARMIHDLSPRCNNPYVVVNAAAIPRELFESEMFGHEKGAFTGAARQKPGHFEVAHTGTIFLDEIADLSLENQARMLRVLESGRFHRVGGTREVSVDVRIVSATNRKISSADGDFRSDLYHRLSGFVISMPPLRQRKSDIPELVTHFLSRSRPGGGFAVRTVSPAALEKLTAYDWPGNVRELRSCVERAAALAQGDTIEPDDIVLPRDQSVESDSGSHLLTLSEAERHHIVRVLKRHKGNIRSAAQALKISRVTLYKKINDYGIEL